jgi:hypothetical protein
MATPSLMAARIVSGRSATLKRMLKVSKLSAIDSQAVASVNRNQPDS